MVVVRCDSVGLVVTHVDRRLLLDRTSRQCAVPHHNGSLLSVGAGRCRDRVVVVYYESIKREVKTKPRYECRYDEELKTRVEESTLLVCTQLVGELEHLKTETRLTDEMFASEMGECAFLM